MTYGDLCGKQHIVHPLVKASFSSSLVYVLLLCYVTSHLEVAGGEKAKRLGVDPVGNYLLKRPSSSSLHHFVDGQDAVRYNGDDDEDDQLLPLDSEHDLAAYHAHAQKRIPDAVGSYLLRKRVVDPVGAYLLKKKSYEIDDGAEFDNSREGHAGQQFGV